MSTPSEFLTSEESGLILEVIDSSLRITRREHFFSWLQGVCQYLIPHEVFLCGIKHDGEESLRYESFISTRYMTEVHVNQATEKEHGLVLRALAAWKIQRRPILIADGLAVGDYGDYHVPFVESVEVLKETELKNLAAHGLLTKHGEVSTFFCFSRIAEPLNAKHAYYLELLAPHLYTLLMRFVGMQHDRLSPNKKPTKGSVTKRELEIIKWMHLGKTNQEIALILIISPLTVKNHVHSILNKLQVENRSNASAKAVQLGLLKN